MTTYTIRISIDDPDATVEKLQWLLAEAGTVISIERDN